MYLDKYLDYLSFEKKYSINTLESYKNDVEGFLTFLKKNGTPINNDLNYSFIRQWIVELSEKRISPITINRKTNDSVQIFGGYGYIKDFPVEKFLRDSKLCTIGEGTSEIQKLVISRKILSK